MHLDLDLLPPQPHNLTVLASGTMSRRMISQRKRAQLQRRHTFYYYYYYCRFVLLLAVAVCNFEAAADDSDPEHELASLVT